MMTIGFVDTATLATCVATAAGKDWNAGVMVWQYPNANAAWISAVRGTAFAIPAASSPTPISASAAPSSTGPVNPPFEFLTNAVAALPAATVA